MPGFMIHGQGGDPSGPSNVVETRRKHRWIFRTISGGYVNIASNILLLLKQATRPHFILEEPVMHHNQEQVYFAGKQSWSEIKLVWYDAESPDSSKQMWDWVNTVVTIPGISVSQPSSYKADATLSMVKGDGTSNKESWQLYGCWPKDIEWGDLDYEDTNIAQISVTMRMDRAVRLQ